MPSIRGSSQFKPISGVTFYGITGSTGPQGPRGSDLLGPTGPTATLILSGFSVSSNTLVNEFTNGTTFGAVGRLVGITGQTTIGFDGKTGSTGTGYVLYSASPAQKEIKLRKIKGSTGPRSFVNVSSTNETITIEVERYDGEYTLSSGSLSEIIAIDNSSNLVGATLGSAKYGSATNVVEINKVNVFEKTKSAAGNTGSMRYQYFGIPTPNTLIYLYLDNLIETNFYGDRNTKSKIFSIDFNQYGNNNVTILLPSPTSEITSCTLHLQNVNTVPDEIDTFNNTFVYLKNNVANVSAPVIFPLNRQPCIYKYNDVTKNYIIHFVLIKNDWYGFVYYSSVTDDYFCGSADPLTSATKEIQDTLDFYDGLTGACCTSVGNCSITSYFGCTGYFAGVGTTCGTIGSTSVCDQKDGVCCVKNTVDGKISAYCIENSNAFDCLSLASNSISTTFIKDKTCVDINCNNAIEEIGACCDGKGNCSELTKVECISSGSSYLGDGVLCYEQNSRPLCSIGVGACCQPTGTCTEITAEQCFQSDGFYHGNGISCAGVTCANSLSCGGFLGFNLKPGDLFGGGVVVGIYNPNRSKILGGAHAFSRHGITATFLSGEERQSGYYASEQDFVGYGFEGNRCLVDIENSTDSYYIIASLYPSSINSEGAFVNPTQEIAVTDEFVWYGTGIAWGPILNLTTYTENDFTYLDKTYEKQYLTYGEGYYNLINGRLDTIKQSTFQTCYDTRKNGTDPIARLFTRNVKTSNGLWNRNWGLYNTIRMISADNADYLKLESAQYSFGEFASGITLSSIRALKQFNNSDYTNSHGLTANPEQLSDWYIPSHDELAFIAANTVTDETNFYGGFNLNSSLLLNNGIPFFGWHWSSTGSFDETSTTEGIYSSGKPKHGSVAWALYFDANGNSENYKVKKENRQTPCKVRPIRAIRCDGKYPNPAEDSYKLWKTPNLLRNER